MGEVRVESLHKAFPDGTVAVHELDLTIADGELFVMLGPSGCGKTTTLRCIAGLETETSGRIVIGDEVVSGLRPSQRDIAMVFQFYALYPHLSVHDNMAFPLRAAGHPAAEIAERVNEAARLLRLEPLMKRKPNKLSGGEQQRVALGRAIVRHPKAFLMDEPLTNLDAELRADMGA
jgi:ABC-type sugar transport system ATPase subunit